MGVGVAALAAGSGFAADSPPALVKDINPGAVDSSPSSLTNVNGTLFFVARDPASGLELWKSDVAPAPAAHPTGTVGTILQIGGAGFGSAKGRVELTVAPGKGPRKLVLKVLDWSDTVIHASVPSGFGSPALCDVAVVPRRGVRQVLPSEFEFLAPVITAAAPSPSPVPWAADQTITLSGRAFGTGRGTVTAAWTDGSRNVTKRCRVVAWPATAAGGGDGPGDVSVLLPKSFKWSSAGTTLTLRNKVGSAVWTVP